MRCITEYILPASAKWNLNRSLTHTLQDLEQPFWWNRRQESFLRGALWKWASRFSTTPPDGTRTSWTSTLQVHDGGRFYRKVHAAGGTADSCITASAGIARRRASFRPRQGIVHLLFQRPPSTHDVVCPSLIMFASGKCPSP